MTKKQRLVLLVSILASFVAFLDGAIVNVALPAIQQDLGGGLSVQQWVVDAYLLTLGSFILIAGSLSDLLGRKRILKLGLFGFGVASLLCAVAPSGGLLIVARALQGIAGALLVPSSLAIIISNFDGPAQGKAVGSWTAWTGISFILGPLVGGALVDYASWRWIFAINILPIAVTLYLLQKVQVAEDIKSNTRVDFIGAVLCALGLGGPVFALIEQPHYGWSDPIIYLPLILGMLLFASFLVYERKTKNAMLPLSLFSNHNFSVGNIATLAIYAGLSASTFLIVLFLQQTAGYSALAAGMATLPVTIVMFLLSPRFGALAGKLGPRLFMGFGPLIAALGFLLMTNIRDADINYWTELFGPILLFGLGLSVTVAPLTAAILGDVPKNQAGIASAVNNAVARVAGLVAIAALGAILTAQFASLMDDLNKKLDGNHIYTSQQIKMLSEKPLQPPPDVTEDSTVSTDLYISVFHTGLLTVSGLLAAGGVISLIGIRNPSKD